MRVSVADGLLPLVRPAQPGAPNPERDLLVIGLTHNRGQVILEFGRTDLVAGVGVTSYYLDPAGALTLAAALKQHAELAEEQRKAGAA